MANLKYDKEITALIVIDPYNDFISEGGKVWHRLKGVAEVNNVRKMLQVLNDARKVELRVFYALHYIDTVKATRRPGSTLRLSRRPIR